MKRIFILLSSLLGAQNTLDFSRQPADLLELLWNPHRPFAVELWAGSEVSFWTLDFVDDNEAVLDPFFMVAARLSFQNVLGFDVFADYRVTGVEGWDQVFQQRNLTVGIGPGATSLQAKVVRDLAFLSWPFSFFQDTETAEFVLRRVSLDYRGLIRRFTWRYELGAPVAVGLDGNSVGGTGVFALPGDFNENRFLLRTPLFAWLMDGNDWRNYVSDLKKRRSVDYDMLLWPTVGIGYVGQRVATPMVLSVQKNPGPLNFSYDLSNALFIVENQFHAFVFSFDMFNPDLAPPGIPFGVNFGFDGSWGTTRLVSGLFESDWFAASRFDITFGFWGSPATWFRWGFNGYVSIYDYTPIEVILNEVSLTATRDAVYNGVSFSKGEKLGLDFFRGETFFGFQLELALHF